jgi:hypothetical protein
MESLTAALLKDLLTPTEWDAHSTDAANNGNANGNRKLQFVHDKEETEQQANDEDGLQGGQRWSPPTVSPTEQPTEEPSLNPTMPPTYHPTPHGEPFVVKGTVWYDRNANGNRDTGVSMADFGSDVEYNMGLGGVKIALVECNAETNREKESSTEALATTMSQGYNSQMKPMLSFGGGVFRLVNIKVDRSYAVRVEAPYGYLFTSGICNDNERGWKCEYSRSSGGGRSLLSSIVDWSRSLQSSHEKESGKKNNNRVYATGIASGRSTECISVDREGIPNMALNFGVMRVGDSKAAEADVALVLDFDEGLAQGRRGLKEMISDAQELPRRTEDSSTVRRYLLAAEDKKAIGSVTAEVLASQLDKRLAQNQVVLDSVNPQDVILSDDSQTSSRELAVALNIKGHYSPPPELDFEYIVNDSINSDTEQIRRDLKEYNQNCRDQNEKVNTGASIADFNEVHSMSGSTIKNRDSSGVYRTVCAEGETLPTIFETSLKEISATKVNEIAFAPIIYVEQGALATWATGPVAGVSGLIALLMGLFVFRRALGPRKVDKYRQLQKTGLVDIGDERRFGEMGGDIDDGSVDSAFYSSDDEEDFGDNATKDKEKKMRAKLRAEAEKSKMNGKSDKDKEKKMRAKLRAEAEKSNTNGKSDKKFAKSSKKFSKMASSKLLSVKSGSADDTDSIPSSNSGKGEKKLRAKKSGDTLRDSAVKKSMRSSTTSDDLRKSKTTKSDLRASTKSSKDDLRKSKRGRDRSEGGDNAKIVNAEKSFV